MSGSAAAQNHGGTVGLDMFHGDTVGLDMSHFEST